MSRAIYDGRYVFVRLLGSGGFGKAILVTDSQDNDQKYYLRNLSVLIRKVDYLSWLCLCYLIESA